MHAGAMNSNPSVDPVCYWVLLTSTLQFCYTSPSFNAAVPEAKRIIGRRFTDYLNYNVTSPDTVAERLRGSYFDQEDKGAVINIEYANVTAIRHNLQTNQWYSDHLAYSFYTPYQLIVSRAGGFILAFLHIKSESSRDCNFHLCEPLKPGDLSTVQQYLPSLEPQPPYHVFQILSNDERRSIIFSTPTTLAGRLTIVPSQLAEGTQNPRDSVTNQGQTSCTKRTKSTFAISTLEGQLLHVQCIILRHGSALLVMYRLTPYVTQGSTPQQQQQPQQPQLQQLPHQPPPVSPAVPIRYNHHPSNGPYQTQAHSEYRRLSAASEGFTQPSPIQQPGSLNTMQQSPYSPDQLPHRNSYDANYPPQSPEDNRSIVSSPLSPVSVRNHHRPRGIPMRRYSLTEQGTASTTGQGSLSPMGSLEEHEVMSHGSMHSPTDAAFIMDHGHRLSTSSTTTDSAISEVAANALRGRPAKEPPKGVICCRSCSTTVTPEWRKGPTGVKDMCNACGLRWNRRLKKMNGERANVGENPIEALPPGIDPETLLEPQRSGGGSKKGHRKKSAESRGPALTTKPAKRRNSDVMVGASGGVSPFAATSPQDIKYHHPHNPHYSQGSSANTSSRPQLPPLFDDGAAYSSPTGQSIPVMSSSGSSSQGLSYHAQSMHTNHRMKPGTSPDSPHGFHNSMNSALPGSSSDHSTPFSPNSYNGGLPNGGNPYPNHGHLGQPPDNRPVLQMPGVTSYNSSSQEVRADPHAQHSPQFERQGSEAHGPSGSNIYNNTR